MAFILYTHWVCPSHLICDYDLLCYGAIVHTQQYQSVLVQSIILKQRLWKDTDLGVGCAQRICALCIAITQQTTCLHQMSLHGLYLWCCIRQYDQ